MHVSILFSGLLLSALANVFNVEFTVALVQSNHRSFKRKLRWFLSPPAPVSDPEAGVQLESGSNAGSHGRGNHGPHRQVGILAVMADGSDT